MMALRAEHAWGRSMASAYKLWYSEQVTLLLVVSTTQGRGALGTQCLLAFWFVMSKCTFVKLSKCAKRVSSGQNPLCELHVEGQKCCRRGSLWQSRHVQA